MHPYQTMSWLTEILHHPGTTNIWLIYQHGNQSLSSVPVYTIIILSTRNMTIGCIIQCLFCFPLSKVVLLRRGVSYACGHVLHNLGFLTKFTKSFGTLKICKNLNSSPYFQVWIPELSLCHTNHFQD